VQQQGLMPQLDALLAQLSDMHQLQLPPGYNPHLKFMSHLWGELAGLQSTCETVLNTTHLVQHAVAFCC
jgi:hypothetical protein